MIPESIYSKAKSNAKRVLDENYIVEAPVNPVLLASNYGLQVASVDFEDKNISGYISFNAKTIYIRRSDDTSRQTFTIAYHLGQYIYYGNMNNIKNYTTSYRRPIGCLSKDSFERKLTTFAANLLVPQFILKEYDCNSYYKLGRFFNVTPDVVAYVIKHRYLWEK